MRHSSVSLTDKQLRWVGEYLVDLNGAAAAVRAGYSAKCARSIAHENLTKPDILAVLRERQSAMAVELQITRQDVIQGVLAGIEAARVQQSPAVMIRGYAELARLLGFYAPEVKRVEVSADGEVEMDRLNSLSDAELLAIVASGGGRIECESGPV